MEQARLRAGAARVCITPDASYFPITHFNNRAKGKPSVFNGTIREDVYVRAVAVESAGELFVWTVLDMPGVPESHEYEALIAAHANIPEDHVMLTCTHDHSNIYADNPVFERFFGEDFTAKVRRYRLFLRDAIANAVDVAVASLQPARMGVGAGDCYLNVYRNEKELGPDAGTYGFLPGAHVDRRLTALRFESLDGAPIALFFNYPVHACAMIHNEPAGRDTGTEISGDFVGHACRMLEDDMGDGAVAVFTSGAAGDLNPLMMARVNIPRKDGSIETVDLGEGGPAVLEFMGTRFYMDVKRVASAIECKQDAPEISINRREFTLPHAAVVMPGPDVPVTFRLGILTVGNVGMILTNGEVFNKIGVRLKALLPHEYPLMITHAGAWCGYVKDDSGTGLYERKAIEAVAEMLGK